MEQKTSKLWATVFLTVLALLLFFLCVGTYLHPYWERNEDNQEGQTQHGSNDGNSQNVQAHKHIKGSAALGWSNISKSNSSIPGIRSLTEEILRENITGHEMGTGAEKGRNHTGAWSTNVFPARSTGQTKAGNESAAVHNCSFVVASVLRRENNILIEFLEHYIANGACHFYFMSTDVGNSTERALFLKLIRPYEQKGMVTHEHREPNPTWTVRTFGFDMQIGRMNDFALRRAKLDKFGDWILVVDLDEFLYATSPNQTVGQVLSSMPSDIHMLCTPWKLFLSSGFVKQPPCVIPHFLLRQKASAAAGMNSKCVIRLSHAGYLGLHYHYLKGVDWKIPEPLKQYLLGVLGKKFRSVNWRVGEDDLRKFPLQLNHYLSQSVEHFMYRRGSRASQFKAEEVLNPGEIFDSELADRKFWFKGGLECGERNMTQYLQFVRNSTH